MPTWLAMILYPLAANLVQSIISHYIYQGAPPPQPQPPVQTQLPGVGSNVNKPS